MHNSIVTRGYLRAEKITRHFAKTFYLASLFLPKERRLSSYALYAICRISDESVDNCNGLNPARRLEGLKRLMESVFSGKKPEDSLLLAFLDTVNKFAIPKERFSELISGMQMDLDKNRYHDFKELYAYCYLVAGVVGLMMVKILGAQNKEAELPAKNLGIAMQLTNILRDIKEDYRRGRIYLPLDEMQKFKITEDTIKNCEVNQEFESFMAYQIKRAREYYLESGPGIKLIAGLRGRFVAIMMREMYSGILKEIENNGYDVFAKRAQVSGFAKMITIVRTIIKGEYLCA
jgi:phytoene synthase